MAAQSRQSPATVDTDAKIAGARCEGIRGARLGPVVTELPRLNTEAFDLPELARLLQSKNMGVTVTMGPLKNGDINSEDGEAVAG